MSTPSSFRAATGASGVGPSAVVSRSATSTPITFRTFAPPPEPAANNNATGQPSQSLDTVLPLPQIFDILPALHELLSRLVTSASQPTVLANGHASEPQTQTQVQMDGQSQQPRTDSQPSQQTLEGQSQPQASINGVTGDAPSASAGAQTEHYVTQQPTYPDQTPLSIQQLVAEVSTIRNMMRRAREAVGALPDVDRSLDEQQEEIEYLRGEVDRLQQVLAGLGGEQAAG